MLVSQQAFEIRPILVVAPHDADGSDEQIHPVLLPANTGSTRQRIFHFAFLARRIIRAWCGGWLRDGSVISAAAIQS
jgi:hypothetical protein